MAEPLTPKRAKQAGSKTISHMPAIPLFSIPAFYAPQQHWPVADPPLAVESRLAQQPFAVRVEYSRGGKAVTFSQSSAVCDCFSSLPWASCSPRRSCLQDPARWALPSPRLEQDETMSAAMAVGQAWSS